VLLPPKGSKDMQCCSAASGWLPRSGLHNAAYCSKVDLLATLNALVQTNYTLMCYNACYAALLLHMRGQVGEGHRHAPQANMDPPELPPTAA
jgi:hypothetical protein